MTKTNWVFISIILGLILVIIFLSKCNKPQVILPVTKTDTLVRYKLDSNYVSTLLTEKNQEYSNMDKHYRDSIAGIYRVATKQINELLQANLKAESEVPAIDTVIITKNVDNTVKSMTQRFRNKWYDATATVGDRPRLLIKVFDTLTMIRHDVTTGSIFNRKHYAQLDVSLSNPVNVISGVKSFIVSEPKPKKFGVGIFVGYGYGLDNQLKRLPIVGVGISYNIIRF